MQNQIYSQPYQQYYPQCANPASSVGAVNIQIFNPTANPQSGFYQQAPCGVYPCNYNNMFVPAPTQNTAQSYAEAPSSNQALANNMNNNGVAAQGQDTDAGVKTQNKPKITITDEYIKSLENYLNSQDKKIRLMGAKELLERFKEDDTRKSDPALTALLNKTLQDPSETVKFVGLTTLDTGYAAGNEETVEILKQLQASDSSYGEDAALASQILLKMSGQTMANSIPQETNASSNLNLQPTENLSQAQINVAPQSYNAINQKMPPDESGILQNGVNAINQTVPTQSNNVGATVQ